MLILHSRSTGAKWPHSWNNMTSEPRHSFLPTSQLYTFGTSGELHTPPLRSQFLLFQYIGIEPLGMSSSYLAICGTRSPFKKVSSPLLWLEVTVKFASYARQPYTTFTVAKRASISTPTSNTIFDSFNTTPATDGLL